MSKRAVQRPRFGRVVVLACASALLALAPQVTGAPPQAPECLIEIHDQSGNVPDGSSLCAVASPKSCTFNLTLCHNVSGCAVGALKKKLHATGHCNPGHLKISPTDSSCSGAFTGIKVPTKKNGKKVGKCIVRVGAHSSDKPAQVDVDKVTLQCMPAGSSCP